MLVYESASNRSESKLDLAVGCCCNISFRDQIIEVSLECYELRPGMPKEEDIQRVDFRKE
jgi:hypothetical protein